MNMGVGIARGPETTRLAGKRQELILLLLFRSRTEELVDRAVEHVGLIDKGHVATLRQHHQLGASDHLVHLLRQ